MLFWRCISIILRSCFRRRCLSTPLWESETANGGMGTSIKKIRNTDFLKDQHYLARWLIMGEKDTGVCVWWASGDSEGIEVERKKSGINRWLTVEEKTGKWEHGWRQSIDLLAANTSPPAYNPYGARPGLVTQGQGRYSELRCTLCWK